jgi:hypothetical protein
LASDFTDPAMNVEEFRTAVRSLATLAKDLWIQNEFYKGYILQFDQIDPERLKLLTEGLLQNAEVRESAHKLFAPIFNVLDSTESTDLVEGLLNKEIPPSKPNERRCPVENG